VKKNCQIASTVKIDDDDDDAENRLFCAVSIFRILKYDLLISIEVASICARFVKHPKPSFIVCI